MSMHALQALFHAIEPAEQREQKHIAAAAAAATAKQAAASTKTTSSHYNAFLAEIVRPVFLQRLLNVDELMQQLNIYIYIYIYICIYTEPQGWGLREGQLPKSPCRVVPFYILADFL